MNSRKQTPSSRIPAQPTTQPQLENTSNIRNLEPLSPIPKPNDLLQHRAIGLIEGIYLPSTVHFCKGTIITSDHTVIETVVLGRVMPILQKKLDLSQPHLWVVYPRTVNKTAQLYVQISGVWAPQALGKGSLESDFGDGFFSIRGEVVEQSMGRNHVVVKIKRADRSLPRTRNKFKLKLKGILPSYGIGYFWDLKICGRDIV